MRSLRPRFPVPVSVLAVSAADGSVDQPHDPLMANRFPTSQPSSYARDWPCTPLWLVQTLLLLGSFVGVAWLCAQTLSPATASIGYHRAVSSSSSSASAVRPGVSVAELDGFARSLRYGRSTVPPYRIPQCSTTGPLHLSTAPAPVLPGELVVSSDDYAYSPVYCSLLISDAPIRADLLRSDEVWPSMDFVFPVTAKDGALLLLLLHSLELMFPQYRRVVLLVEQPDLYIVRGVLPIDRGRYTIVVVVNPYRELEQRTGRDVGYLLHQLYKMYSDQFSDADFISILDADMIFSKRAKPQHFFHVDPVDQTYRPIQIIRPWSDLIKYCPSDRPLASCEHIIWKAGTDFAINGRDPTPSDTNSTYTFSEHAFMASHPFTYPRDMFVSMRSHMERVHGHAITRLFSHFFGGLNWRLDGASDKFSEFNVFGFFAWQSAEFHNAIHWLELREGAAHEELSQVLSHFSRHRSNTCSPLNPKVTYAYIMSAVMEMHQSTCREVYANDTLCDFSPPDSLVSEFTKLDRERDAKVAAEQREAELKAAEAKMRALAEKAAKPPASDAPVVPPLQRYPRDSVGCETACLTPLEENCVTSTAVVCVLIGYLRVCPVLRCFGRALSYK